MSKSLFEKAVKGLKKATEELGGKDPHVTSYIDNFTAEVKNYKLVAQAHGDNTPHGKSLAATHIREIGTALDKVLAHLETETSFKVKSAIFDGIEKINESDMNSRHELVMSICMKSITAHKDASIFSDDDIESLSKAYAKAALKASEQETFNPKEQLELKKALYQELIGYEENRSTFLSVDQMKDALDAILKTSSAKEIDALFSICKKANFYKKPTIELDFTDLDKMKLLLVTASAVMRHIAEARTREVSHNRLFDYFNMTSPRLSNTIYDVNKACFIIYAKTHEKQLCATRPIFWEEVMDNASTLLDEIEVIEEHSPTIRGKIMKYFANLEQD